MSGGGGGSQTTQQHLPPWLDEASQKALARSEAITAKPYQAYTGDRTANLNGDQLAAMQGVRNMQGQTGAALTGLAGQASGVMGTQAPQVTAGSLAGTNLQQYMDPHLATVEQGALRQLDRQRQLAQVGNEDRAIGAGAFGGSRMAVQQGVTDAEAAAQAGTLSANLRSQAFNNAQTAATADLNRGLTAQQSNQSAYLQNLGLGLQGIQLGGSLLNQAHTTNGQDLDALAGVGQQQQALQQADLDIAAQEWANRMGWDQQQLNTQLNTLKSIPYAGGTTVSGNLGNGPSPAMGALGGAASGATMGSVAGPWGAAAGAVVGGAMGYFGSRR